MIWLQTNMRLEPMPDDWAGPVIYRAEIYDCGDKIGLLIRHKDGRVEGCRISAEEIMEMAG